MHIIRVKACRQAQLNLVKDILNESNLFPKTAHPNDACARSSNPPLSTTLGAKPSYPVVLFAGIIPGCDTPAKPSPPKPATRRGRGRRHRFKQALALGDAAVKDLIGGEALGSFPVTLLGGLRREDPC